MALPIDQRDDPAERPLFDAWVPVVRPELPPGIARSCSDTFSQILASGQLTNGPHVRHLEEMVADRLGVKECVAVSSCTAGLLLVLRCLDLEGEVILPSFTFFATAHAALWNGLEPVLVDCERDTFNIDPEQVREAITSRTSAILAVHVYGNPAAAGELEAIAAEHGLRLVFDAAHGLGASVEGGPLGSLGDAEVFSLSPTKMMVAGEGGLVTTNDSALAARLRLARNYGDGGTYDCELLGLNARMTEFQAVLAAAGLEGVEERSAHRERNVEVYARVLAGQPGVAFQRVRPGHTSSRKDLGILVDETEFGVSRDFVCAALERDNVQTRRYFDPPLHRQRLYRDCRRVGDLRNTEWIAANVLNPPVYTRLGEQRAALIAERIVSIRDAVRARGYPSWWSGPAPSGPPGP
jgi:dTDP-4-amino-4,6-dideoxygalactose transaminase